MRTDAKLRQLAVIGFHRLVGGQLPVGDEPEKPHKRELVLGRIDFTAEERDAGAVPLGIGHESKRIVRSAGAATQDPHDDRRVIGRQLFGDLRPEVRNLEEDRPARPWHSRQASHDVVGKEPRDVPGLVARGLPGHAIERIRKKHLQEMAEAGPLGFDAEVAVGREHRPIERGIVVECEGKEAQVRTAGVIRMHRIDPATPCLRNRRRGEGQGGLAAVAAGTGGQPDVGRVVHPHGGRDMAADEQPFLDRQHLARARAHEHDVDQALPNDLANGVAKLADRPEWPGGRAPARSQTGRGQPECHVGILGIGQNKVLAGRVGHDAGELQVERFLWLRRGHGDGSGDGGHERPFYPTRGRRCPTAVK